MLFGSKLMPDAAGSLGTPMRIFKGEFNQMQAENTSTVRTAATRHTTAIPARYRRRHRRQPAICP
ncbi:twin-arginine translocase TatA/TatE family subunit [Nocardia sp. NPDC059239]|uniref:twin-arginine translocase TatA/TatE family subunit n=1 Tax=Nocardia sp. NPDC059239 TaxID=3346785 RepID=UPI0036815825